LLERKQHEIAPDLPVSFTWDAESLWERTAWRIQVPDPTLHAFRQAVEGLVPDDGFLENYAHGELNIPGLEELAGQVREELQQGSGVAWVKGPPAADFTEAQMKLFYLAVGEAMGDTMGNYGRLYDVKDSGGSYKKERIPVSQTRSATGFHTDSSARNTMPDIVALLCVQPARAGGESLVVSAATVHEELRKTNLEALTLLYREFIRDVVTPGAGKTHEALLNNRFPVFSQGLYGPGLSFRYMRYWIEKGHQEADMVLAEEELAALDTLDALLALPKFAVEFRLEAGDQVWVNNHMVAHNRTGYEEDPQEPRHLVRMWIST
jgi:hypothetical protein